MRSSLQPRATFFHNPLFYVAILVVLALALSLGAWSWGGVSRWFGDLPVVGRLFSGLFGSSVGNQALFNPAAGLTQEQARELYRKALQAKEQGNAQEAIKLFKELEPAYPALKDIISLELATLYTDIPQEDLAQLRYRVLLEELPNSPLRQVARYRLAQSLLRTSLTEEGLLTLRQLRQEAPDSDWGLGALYYLGAQEAPNTKERHTLWFEYLQKAPDGSFAFELAQTLESELGSELSPKQAEWLGLTYVAQKRQWKKAAALLESAANRQIVWWPLAQAYKEAGDKTAAKLVIENGLGYAKTEEEAKQGLDLWLNLTPANERLSGLKQLDILSLKPAGAYILWQLSNVDSANAKTYFNALVQRYPESAYAPESSWQALWGLLSSGQDAAFLQAADAHLQRYANSRSAPRVLFWKGRVYEQQKNQQQAKAAYLQALQRYPWTYFAYRSYGRLQQVSYNEADVAWKTDSKAGTPPLQQATPSLGAVISPLETSMGKEGEAGDKTNRSSQDKTAYIAAIADELAAIGATASLELYLSEALKPLPPAAEAWMLQQTGKDSQSLRLMRNAVVERFQQTGKGPTDAERKLLYPLEYSALLAKEARANELDMLLALSLMREESYFNPLAVSSSYAMGLMQLLPSTAKDVAQWLGMASFQPVELFRPEVNVPLGCRYLGYLHQRFEGKSMLAVGAYNGGPGAMSGWVKSSGQNLSVEPDWFVETIPYAESKLYIEKVFESYWNYLRLYRPEALPHFQELMQAQA